MDPESKSVSRFDTDNTVDEDKDGPAKKSKVDPPRNSNISAASSEDFFHLDPKLLPMFNVPKVPHENAQSPLRDDQSGFGRNSSFKSEDHDRWSQGTTSRISDITHESMLQNMSPTRSPQVQVMERHKDHAKYDPNRIPSSAFASKSSTLAEWSAASNDSLFSIRLGNDSREHARKIPGDLHKHEDFHKAADPLKFRKPFPAMERKGDSKRLEVKNKSGSDEPHAVAPKETIDESEVRFSPIEISFSSPQANRHSDGSELDTQKFAGSIKNSGCSTCNCANCRWTMCACTWPRCCCFSDEWPSCWSCKWSSCWSCKWSSCCSCKWPSCCSCKWPSCCSCKWPSCCSCKWPSCCSCKWPSCCLCKWPSCCSCKWRNCCSCKWPSCFSKLPSCCGSCGWPSCPRCSFKCFRCSSCSCGWPSCSSCSCKCFSWPSCNCSSCSWPFICCWKCKPKRFCCCSSETSTNDEICDPQKTAPKRRLRCCHFPRFSWSWFSCRCC